MLKNPEEFLNPDADADVFTLTTSSLSTDICGKIFTQIHPVVFFR